MKKIRISIGLVALLTIFFVISCEEEGIVDSGFGRLEGTVVTNGDNIPLENVKITTNPASTTVFTDENGEFLIEEILIGEYSVQAELDEYITAFEAALITEGNTVNVVFELELTSSINEAPLVPILLTPEDNATDVLTTVDFVWTSSANDSDVISYNFELRNGSNNEILMAEELEDTTFNVSNLEINTSYFWQVTASDGVNTPVESSLSSFTTESGSNNRFLYVRKIGNNNVIYSGTDTGANDTPNENEIRITPLTENSFRPRKNQTANRIAFLRTVGSDTQLFVMKPDGTQVQQLTNQIPVVGFRQDEVDYTWYQNGQRIYYPNLNKIYSVNLSGTGTELEYEAPAGTFITEIDTNETNGLIAIKTNDVNGYNARIVIVNPNTGIESVVVAEGFDGALGGIDYSIDGSKVLYTRDVSGFENPEYRQLDTRVFQYRISNNVTIEIDTDKPAGTNDLDVKYAPNEGAVIFTNTSNDGISQRNVVKVNLGNDKAREVLFENASMPDWE